MTGRSPGPACRGPRAAWRGGSHEPVAAAKQEAAGLRLALEERKLIERAKGTVMRRLKVDEADAFRRLRRLSSDRNWKVIEVARHVLNAEEVFALLDRAGGPR
jgi:AmiR/NasT family two-component response regulator